MVKEVFTIVDLHRENCNSFKMFSKVLDELNYELDLVNVVKAMLHKIEILQQKMMFQGHQLYYL